MTSCQVAQEPPLESSRAGKGRIGRSGVQAAPGSGPRAIAHDYHALKRTASEDATKYRFAALG